MEHPNSNRRDVKVSQINSNDITGSIAMYVEKNPLTEQCAWNFKYVWFCDVCKLTRMNSMIFTLKTL